MGNGRRWHLCIFLFTFIIFTCPHSKPRPVKKNYCFSSSYWNTRGGCCPAASIISLLLWSYKVTLQLSHHTQRQKTTQTLPLTHTLSGEMLEPGGAHYDLALLSCWPWRERIASVGTQWMCVSVSVCTIYKCLVVMGNGGGCTSFELRALSRDKLLWHHKATWSISLFSLCQDHFMWWWFDAWVLGLLLPLSDWAMIVGAGIAGITELPGSSHHRTAMCPLATRTHWQIPFLLYFQIGVTTSLLQRSYWCINDGRSRKKHLFLLFGRFINIYMCVYY